jgi:mRNA-degrading endonuclease RelE of RelBE toxin-antitoxin system
MNLDYHPEARQEFLYAVEYSEAEFRTGEKLRLNVVEIHELLLRFPKIGVLEEASIWRYSLPYFPFSIIYSYDEQEKAIFILAFMHNARKPGYWKDRL